MSKVDSVGITPPLYMLTHAQNEEMKPFVYGDTPMIAAGQWKLYSC